jgi:hypothetical protein
MPIELTPVDEPQEVGNHADALWSIAKRIEPDMQDIAEKLKEIASELHDVRRRMRKRQWKETGEE